jgi:hypothetical protein
MSKILCEGAFIRWKPRPHNKESFIAADQELKEFLHAFGEKHGIIPH